MKKWLGGRWSGSILLINNLNFPHDSAKVEDDQLNPNTTCLEGTRNTECFIHLKPQKRDRRKKISTLAMNRFKMQRFCQYSSVFLLNKHSLVNNYKSMKLE